MSLDDHTFRVIAPFGQTAAEMSTGDITPEDVRLYLAGHDWNEKEVVNDYLSIWSREGVRKELYVPRSMQIVDYGEQLALLVHFLSRYEGRSPVQIMADLRHNSSDVIRLRIDTTAIDRGTIGLRRATEVLNDAERMLLSAARAAQSPQSFFPAGGPPAEVSDYMDTTRLAQTEPGSFVFTLISPVSYHSKHEPLANTAPEIKPPFARRVIETLAESLNAIRSAAVFQERAMTAVFEDLVEHGVSANLCEALSGIAEQSRDNALDVDFSWSAKSPVPKAHLHDRVIVPAMVTSVLRDMATHLKSVLPELDYELIGRVERLLNQKDNDGFDLYVEATVHGTKRLVALKLNQEERADASIAWHTGKSIYVKGMLDRRYRPYRLQEPTAFGLVESL